MKEPEAVRSNHYCEFIQEAITDGYEEVLHGVWGIQKQPHEKDEEGRYVTVGRHPGDNTIVLTKDDVVLWFVDRVINVTGKREFWTQGWFSEGKHAMTHVPKKYSPQAIEDLRGTCNYCHKPGDPTRLALIGFVGKVCPECDTKELRNKIEFPGWTD